jgi:formylglycine-generating enzyme required for sulfatase activity
MKSRPLRSFPRSATAFVFAIATCVGQISGIFAKETSAAAGPGLVAEKPAGGPFVEVDGLYMVPYTETLPGTDITFEMIPVPGGEFVMGSPDTEADRAADEGPQVRIKVAPFWIAKCEVTWAEYKSYMALYDAFKKLQLLATNPDLQEGDASAASEELKLIKDHAWNGNVEDDWGVDAVTTATPLYDSSFTYEAGDADDQPAVTMTQFAAKQYTKWLSGILGRGYRLPSEAEWEYACRAGSSTTYSFGDDPAQLSEYAWFDENADYQTHPVASKKPNAWGIYDMHGNVAEWTLDEFREETYAGLGEGPVDAAIAVCWPTKVYPRVIRGGSWLDAAPILRSAARHKSEEDEWKIKDPNIPKSPWWFTEEPATGVGMRVVRPLKPLSDEEKARVWEADVDDIRQDLRDRLREGRAAMGMANETLPATMKAAESIDSDS